MYPASKPFSSNRKPYKRFIKGPIPLAWVQQAAKLPGRTLHLGMALWYLAGLRKSNQGAVNYKVAEHFGLNRYTVYRGLARLKEAHLIEVSSKPGRRLNITLIEGATFVTEGERRDERKPTPKGGEAGDC